MRDRNHQHPGVKSPKMGTRGGFVRAEAEREGGGIRAPTSPGIRPDSGGLRHAVMCAGALGFLIAIGLVMPHGDSGAAFRNWLMSHPLFWPLVAALWGIVIMEGLLGLFLATDAWLQRLIRLLLTSLVPPARMIAASSMPPGWLWVPRAGWMPAGKATLLKFEQKAALPMTILTLLVLPVLAVELAYGEALDNYPYLALATHLTTSAIWLGFTTEFLWMVAVAPKRLTYCMQHWINLVIIVVPLAAFLRVLNVFRLARVVRAGRLLRAYRLRGLSARVWRLVMLFNLFERLQQRDPVKYCEALQAKIDGLEEEMAGLRVKLDAARKRIPPPVTPSSLPPPAPVGTRRRERTEK